MAWRAGIAVLLVALTAAVFLQVRGHGFVNYDDPTYVTQNPNLEAGLGLESVTRAFVEPYEKNWIPLTWISLQIDHDLYGMEAAGFLLTNLGLHATSVVLLFLLLCRITGATGRSAFVAAVFAIHPVHVESVAWVSERKDVLSGVFWILTLWAYAFYTERESSLARYLVVALCLVMSLLAKPMAVTLPFVLLLLDFWPLGRLAGPAGAFDRARIRRALVEKVPLLAIVAVAALVTYLVQSGRGATSYGDRIGPELRVMNALSAVLVYLRQSFWPTDLACFYPHPMTSLGVGRALATAAALLGATALALREAIRRPYLTVGWLWFLGTLVPVIGLVQVGAQAHADRYLYLPQIGLGLAVAWGVADVVGVGGGRKAQRPREWGLAAAGAATVCVLAIVAWHQVQHWKDSSALFERALAVTEGNFVAHHFLGVEREREGRMDEAEREYEAAVALRPPWLPPYLTLAAIQVNRGAIDPAIRHYRAALALNPDTAQARLGLGMSLVKKGRFDTARAHLVRADDLGSRSAPLQSALAIIASGDGRAPDAARRYRAALEIDPDYGPAINNLAWLLATSSDASVHDPGEAVRLAEGAAREASQPDPGKLDTLAAAYAATGRFDEAHRTQQRAISLLEADGRDTTEMRARLALYREGRAYVEGG